MIQMIAQLRNTWLPLQICVGRFVLSFQQQVLFFSFFFGFKLCFVVRPVYHFLPLLSNVSLKGRRLCRKSIGRFSDRAYRPKPGPWCCKHKRSASAPIALGGPVPTKPGIFHGILVIFSFTYMPQYCRIRPAYSFLRRVYP